MVPRDTGAEMITEIQEPASSGREGRPLLRATQPGRPEKAKPQLSLAHALSMGQWRLQADTMEGGSPLEY